MFSLPSGTAPSPSNGCSARRYAGPLTSFTVVVLLTLIPACGAESGDGDQPGQSAVYERIAALTDCAELQSEFDRASANNGREEAGSTGFEITLSYMQAADDRMREVGCYDT